MRIALLLILAPLAIPASSGDQHLSSVLPDIETTRGFLEMCAAVDKKPTDQSHFELFQTGYCTGWVAGFTGGMQVAEANYQVGEKIYCLPVGNSYGQMIRIIKKFIADHPEMEHLPTGSVAGAALREAFPCKESK